MRSLVLSSKLITPPRMLANHILLDQQISLHKFNTQRVMQLDLRQHLGWRYECEFQPLYWQQFFNVLMENDSPLKIEGGPTSRGREPSHQNHIYHTTSVPTVSAWIWLTVCKITVCFMGTSGMACSCSCSMFSLFLCFPSFQIHLKPLNKASKLCHCSNISL